LKFAVTPDLSMLGTAPVELLFTEGGSVIGQALDDDQMHPEFLQQATEFLRILSLSSSKRLDPWNSRPLQEKRSTQPPFLFYNRVQWQAAVFRNFFDFCLEISLSDSLMELYESTIADLPESVASDSV
jgi:hypothetical protein